MSDKYTIFVTDSSIDENAVEHHEVIQWSYNNLNHPNVIAVTSEQIYYLTETGILDVISELNDSLLGEGEDDWVIENDVKVAILERLKSDFKSEDVLLKKLKELFEYSIRNSRNIYFHF
ncbi:DMP12 family DNA mimic protein [Zooshikella harenae]|uniref:DNA mimic protein n=1 Tax=Zooshikella harenae TaxID=2827238 RepID=A0ABS5ZBD4_9GAMM|nr:DMP12 family DNA mimic protein [Zooshikella harenae]MBU2711369.1 DNA mimic protein [Zooshikella harenae]